jgi:AraC-like DNA-binding protein
VLLSHRKTGIDRLGASMQTHALFCERFRVHAVENRQVVSEDRLSALAYDRLGKVGRPVVTVLLEGAARIEAFGRSAWIAAGQASVVEAKGALLMRQSRNGERYRAIVVEWEPGHIGPRPEGFRTFDAPSSALRDAEAIEAAVTNAELADGAGATILAAVENVCGALGIPLALEPASEAASAERKTDAATRELSRALDDLLSDMRDRPMMVDLHSRLGVSERTVNRMVQDFNARFGFNASTWQDARSRRRVLISGALLTANGATASEVAEAVGYSSLPSLTRALKQAGMPSPRDVPRFVRELSD